ncbi:hypothetical protein EAE99_007558 [Botrytis elliptica]|nr:hypothetical protein EAE99_007558 [Botrytis elliptica]
MNSDLGMGLINRKRIWKLGIEMVSLMQTIEEPGRFLHGDIVTDVPIQRHCSTVSCLALKRDLKGCKQVTQRSMHWGKMHVESQLCTVTPSYVDILERQSVNIGYIVAQRNHLTASTSLKILWLVASSLDIETIGIDIYPHSSLNSKDEVAEQVESRTPYGHFYLSNNFPRLFELKEETGTGSVLWVHPYLSTIPSMLDDDIVALHELQNNSFAPASTLYIKPETGNLLCTGITGIDFICNTCIRRTCGSDYATASLSFFLQEFEYLGRIKVYKINSVVYHLQFITDLNRTSEFMPPAPTKSGVSFDCVEYISLDNGYIVGLCGCFVVSWSSKEYKPLANSGCRNPSSS